MRSPAVRDPVFPRLLAAGIVAFLCAEAPARAEPPGGAGAVRADEARRAAIIDAVSAALNEVYVFPDVAARIEERLREKLASGAYDGLDTVPAFADALDEDLRDTSHDLHLGVAYSPPEERPVAAPDSEDRGGREREALAHANFGFVRVERLPGNVGYLRLDRFADASLSAPTAIAALNFLAECDALIIDLRWNKGGDPSLIQLMASYFFAEPTLLSSFYIRRTDQMMQFWTQAHVSGPRMDGVDLYVVVSSETFSAAEGFCYSLQARNRATILGETTGGGAHPVERRRFPDLGIAMSIPFGRPIDPLTGSNWEGTGVVPEIAVRAEEALRRAHLEALRKLREAETGEERRAELASLIEGIEAKQQALAAVDGRQDESPRTGDERSAEPSETEGQRKMVKNLACWWEINAKDGKHLVDFYSEVFDWEPTYDERTGIWHIDSGNGADGGIGGGIFTGKGKLPTHRCLYVLVDDVDAIVERAKRAGQPILQGPFDLENGTRLAFFQDPEGHMIGLIKPARKKSE